MRKVCIPILLPEWVFRLRVWIALRYRKIRYGYAFRRIPLTQEKYAIVDRERYEELAKYKWHLARSERGLYAVRMVKAKKGGRYSPPIGKPRGKQECVRMHWVVLKPPEGKFIDHINHNGLDNRIANLRVATPQQNMWNMRKRRCNCNSKYKGVHWLKRKKKWRARITFNGRGIFIGDFDTEKEAGMAYDARARQLFGDYASPNLPSSKGRG